MLNSKICIVTTRTINDSPCLEKYRKLLNEPFDIIYWTKGELDKECGAAEYYKYEGIVPTEKGKLIKVYHYIKFICFAKRIIRKKKYEKLIVYPTQTGWMLQGMLKRKYKGKYLFDVRDYAGENNRIISKLTSTAVNNSGLCSITCPAYKNFLPKGKDYIISHNLQTIDDEIVSSYRQRQSLEGPIVLSFIGTVRFFSQLENIIKVFGNDDRFYLKFIGRGSEKLQSFCQEGEYKNVELIGQFERSELGKYYLETDMAINLYGNERPALVYALSNKLYSAAIMGMPLIVSPKTYSAEIVEKYGIGFSVDLNSNSCADNLYDKYQKLDKATLVTNCEKFLLDVSLDESTYASKIISFFK